LEKPFAKKRAGGGVQGVSPGFKPQYCKKIFFMENEKKQYLEE
jgi:hypothetical protein